MSDSTLSAELEELIERVVVRTLERGFEMLGAPPASRRLLGPAALAAELGVSVDYVYDHQVELGVMRLGDGPRARLRFDLDRAQQALGDRSARRPTAAASARGRR